MSLLAEELERLVEAKPNPNRKVIANKPTTNSSKASAEIFSATDVWLHVNLGLKDLRDLIAKREVVITAKDRKRRVDQVNAYKITLQYKGKGVSNV